MAAQFNRHSRHARVDLAQFLQDVGYSLVVIGKRASRAASVLVIVGCSRGRPIRLVRHCGPTEKMVVLLDLFDACVVFFTRKPGDLVGDGCLDAPSIINRHPVAKLIEPLMHSIPKVAALMNDIDSALRDAL